MSEMSAGADAQRENVKLREENATLAALVVKALTNAKGSRDFADDALKILGIADFESKWIN